MRMHWLAAGVALLFPMSVVGSIGPPISGGLLRAGLDGGQTGEPFYASPDIPFSGVVVLRAHADLTLSGFQLVGEAWSVIQLSAPTSATLSAGDTVHVSFEVVSSTPDRPLSLVADFSGPQAGAGVYHFPLDFSYRSFHWSVGPKALISLRAAAPFPGVDTTHVPPGPPLEAVSEAAPLVSAAGRSVSVTGQLVYRRRDGKQIGADGVSVEVLDDNGILPSTSLVSGVTDWNGNFDLSFNWDGSGLHEDDPDIYVVFKSRNSEIDVTSPIFETTYSWATEEKHNYGGPELELGTLIPADEDDQGILHILTTLVRAWRWLKNQGFDAGLVQVKFTLEAIGAFYNVFGGSYSDTPEIYLPRSLVWDDPTHVHEYGHHWLMTYSYQPQIPNYWNGVCDQGILPGHCAWCEEGGNGSPAWSEGFADWLSDVIPRSFKENYGLAPNELDSYETAQACVDGDNAPCPCDPLFTEGFFAALLRDIEDDGNDDQSVTDGVQDVLSLGVDEILQTANLDEPTSPAEFLDAFLARNTFLRYDLWETAENLGFGLDAAAPAAPVLGDPSPSHDFGAGSPDATIDVLVALPSDDWSGIAGFSFDFVRDLLTPLDNSIDITVSDPRGATLEWSSAPLTPGEYYFRVRAIDRAGRIGPDAVTSGTYVIREWIPADIVPSDPLAGGWTYQLVPRNTPDATPGVAILPSTLDTTGTYWNAIYQNDGDDPTGGPFRVQLEVDGVDVSGFFQPELGPWAGGQGTNKGPVTIRGGRHTLVVRLDSTEGISEANENNNVWGRQWIWDPFPLSLGSRIERPAPPNRTGGWPKVTSGQTQLNCDGLVLNNGPGRWNAAAVYAGTDTEDVDCRLHLPNSGADDNGAFGVPVLAWSRNGPGNLDAVIVNRDLASEARYDVGVVEVNDGTGTYFAQRVSSTAFPDMGLTSGPQLSATADTVNLLPGRMIVLLDIDVQPPLTSGLTCIAEINPADGPVGLAWLDGATTFVSLDSLKQEYTDETGRAVLDVDTPGQMHHCLVVFRNPGSEMSGITVLLTLDGPHAAVGPPPALPGWFSSLVPRPLADGTPVSVAHPDTLYGDTTSTYLNLAVGNFRNAPASSVVADCFLDGEPFAAFPLGAFAPLETRTVNDAVARYVSGGRHTLSMMVDDELLPDLFVGDNRTGRQYTWSPFLLQPEVPVARSGPPQLTGGWTDEIDVDDILRFNCDGFRLPDIPGEWRGVAVMPASGCDVDVRLHTPRPGAADAFGGPLVFSGWGPGEPDFCLVNERRGPSHALDVGVIRGMDAPQPYTLEAVGSTSHGAAPGNFGPFVLPEGRILALHEFYLDVGGWLMIAGNDSGVVDWGMSLHPEGLPFSSRSKVLHKGIAWLNAAGASESLRVEIDEPGYYCLAVWKAEVGSLPYAGAYRIRIEREVTGVPDSRTGVSGPLMRIFPNPFHAGARVEFQLDETAAVDLTVFDISGAVVRRLHRGLLPPGSHEVEWDGLDNFGRDTAAGLYLVHLRTGARGATRHVVKLD